jgi:hypothetical protein
MSRKGCATPACDPAVGAPPEHEGVGMNSLVRNTVRGILGLLLAAAATWLTNFIIDKVFGPEEEYKG